MKFSKKIIISQAIEIMSIQGIDKVTLKQVSDHIGMKQTALLYHYKSKESLVNACLRETVLKNNEIVSSKLNSQNVKNSIHAYILGNIEWALDNRYEARLILYLYYKASFNNEYKSLYHKIKQSAQNRITSFLKEAGLSYDLQSVSLVHEALIGGIMHLIVKESNPSDKEVLELVDRLLKVVS